MTPRTIGEELVRHVPLLRVDQDIRSAVKEIVNAEIAALPVLDERGRLAGIFGEREFISAVFPGYFGELTYAAFVSQHAQEQIELRTECALEPVGKYMNTEHADVSSDWSDAQLAEIFLHHRVLIIPIADDGEVKGVITRADFFKALVQRLDG